MYDYVKVSFSSNHFANYLKQSEYLSFVKESRREYSTAHTYSYHGLVFDIYDSGRVIISGSLHKYWNAGKHNHNDFYFADLLSCIKDLTDKFTPYILVGKVNNIEVGLNIRPPFKTTEYLSRIIGIPGTERHPITKNDLKGFEKGFHFRKSQYGIKIYNKGKQYNRLEQILRHEIKTYKMQALEDVGIETLFDLCSLQKLEEVVRFLLNAYSAVLINEIVSLDDLSKPKERIYLECINHDSWNNWGKDKRYKRKIQFEEIISEFGRSDIKQIVSDLMRSKVNELLTTTQKSTDVFTNLKSLFTRVLNSKSTDIFTINIMGKNVVSKPPKRTCLSCGKDIGHQGANSKFCSAKYVGYDQAHKCRNSASNPKNNLARKIDRIKALGILFEIEPFLKLQSQL